VWQAVEVLWPATARVRVLQASTGCTLLGGAGEDQQHGTPQLKTFRSELCAGYRRRAFVGVSASPPCRLLTANLKRHPILCVGIATIPAAVHQQISG
jgi:hypothetical protein